MSQEVREAKVLEEPNRLNVLMITENQLLRFGIGAMLKSLSFGRQESCADVTTGVRQIRSTRFHVLILHASLGDEQCDLLTGVSTECSVKVLLLLDSSEPECAVRASKISVDGFLLQNELTLESLGDALYLVMRGELVMPSKLARELLTHVGRDEPDPRRVTLTPREREILAMLARGMSNKQIARRLDISEHGTKRHVGNVLAKLNCANRTMAAAMAIQAGILSEA